MSGSGRENTAAALNQGKPPLLLVGITGRSGSGKSSVAAHYAALGYPLADGDVLSRQVTAPGSVCLAELSAAFGGEIMQADGSLNRRRLGELAFASPEANARLVGITHPHIVAELLRAAWAAHAAGSRLFFIDGAMIVGGPVQPYCDRLVVVRAEQRLSVSRIILRDDISKTMAYSRLAAQPEQALLDAAADYIIDNNGSPEALRRQAEEVLKQLLPLAVARRLGEGRRRDG